MSTLQDQPIKDTYKNLLQMSGGANTGITSALQTVQDGGGVNSILQLSQTKLKIAGDFEVTGTLTGISDGLSVTAGTINSSGQLVLTMSDNTTINCGVVKGTNGVNGTGISGASVNNSGNLILTLSDGDTLNAGAVRANDGAAGVSVTNGTVNASGNLILTLSNNTTIDCGLVKGADGEDGDDGTGGTWKDFDTSKYQRYVGPHGNRTVNLHGSPWYLPSSATEVLLQIDTGEAYVYINGVLAHAGANNAGIGNYYGPLPLTISTSGYHYHAGNDGRVIKNSGIITVSQSRAPGDDNTCQFDLRIRKYRG